MKIEIKLRQIKKKAGDPISPALKTRATKPRHMLLLNALLAAQVFHLYFLDYLNCQART
jgi:hypothetical protein